MPKGKEESKMKILITTDLYSVTTNGVVTSLKNLRDEMLKRGHDVRVITFSADKTTYKDEPEQVYYIGSSSMEWVYPGVRRPLKYRDPLVDELIEWCPDVIHSQCEFFSFFFALRISKKTGAPIVHTYHTMYEDYAQYVIKLKRFSKTAVRWFSKNRLDKTDCVVAPTSKVKELLVRYKVKAPIEIIPTGISLEQHKERISAEERVTMRTKYGISDSDVLMLNLGRLGNEKNVEELVDFCAKAQNDVTNLKFLIVGDGPARAMLEELTEKLNMKDKIIFAGRVDPKEVQKYYQLGDIFVSASTSETQGLTYVEAAANGLPLLCRKDPCLDEVITQGENGYAYETEEEFLTYIKDMASSAEWRSAASEKSTVASKRFDKSVFGDSIMDIYKRLVK